MNVAKATTIEVRYVADDLPPEIAFGTVPIPMDCKQIVWQLKNPPQHAVSLDVVLPQDFHWRRTESSSSQVVVTGPPAGKGFVLPYQASVSPRDPTLLPLLSDTRHVAVPTPADEEDGTIVISFVMGTDGNPAVDKEAIVLLAGTKVKWDFTALRNLGEEAPRLVFTSPSGSPVTGPFTEIARHENGYVQIGMGDGGRYSRFVYAITNESGSRLVSITIDPQIDYLPPPPDPDRGKGPVRKARRT